MPSKMSLSVLAFIWICSVTVVAQKIKEPIKPWGSSPDINATLTGQEDKKAPLYEPPQGFCLTARVYTDQHDKMAHFDNESSITFPYWDCGVHGSTTVPIPLQHASVRHLLGGSQPSTFSGEENGAKPQLIVALTPLDIVLNSGETQTFSPGDVILLEDVLSGGHKLKGHDKQDMKVMILTLPQHYTHVGKDKSSMDHLLDKSVPSPCLMGTEESVVSPQQERKLTSKIQEAFKSLGLSRRKGLTAAGLSLSSISAFFVQKIAPVWLTVGFSGGCFVACGTAACVQLGEYGINEFELWKERRQLQINGEETFGFGATVTEEGKEAEENE